jgi:hypothetical protein
MNGGNGYVGLRNEVMAVNEKRNPTDEYPDMYYQFQRCRFGLVVDQDDHPEEPELSNYVKSD